MNNTYTDDINEQVVLLDHHIDIPGYVRRFDALLSFLNIKTEDVSMLFAVGKPASKAVTLERYKMFLKLDFRNFVHSSYAESIRSFLFMWSDVRNYANLKNVGDETIDAILGIVGRCYKDIVSPLNPEDRHLLYMRVCGALRKKWNKEKNEWLVPFFGYKNDAYIKIGALCLEDKDFLISLISVMNVQKEKYRKEIYSVMLLLIYVYELSAHSGICNGKQLQESVNMRLENDCFQSFTLLDANSPLTAEELAVLNGPSLSEEERKIVMSHLNRFKDRVNVDAALSSYVTPYHKLRLDLLTPQQCVEVFFKKLDRLKADNPYPEDASIEDIATPKCYLAFLAENIYSGELIDWEENNSLVNGLMYLIYIKQGKDIVYIVKEVTVFNYIIEHMADAIDVTDDETLLNETIEKALNFIDVIFGEEFIGKANSSDSLKSKFRVILRDSELRKKITQISPNKFNGGFNLVLVYNVIGLFIDQGLIKGKYSKIDSEIAKANGQLSLKGKLLERRTYISCWNIDNTSELTRKIIDKIISTYL